MTALFGCCSREARGKAASERTPEHGAARRWKEQKSEKQENGAQSRDRTSDTAIFNRMLYQLSYLGFRLRCQRHALCERTVLYGFSGTLSTQSLSVD
jgi:hypothetical protein